MGARGKKPGTKHLMPTPGSLSDCLSQLEVGQRMFVETCITKWRQDMRNLVRPKSRRPEILQDREFSTSLVRAITTDIMNVGYFLICVERIK